MNVLLGLLLVYYIGAMIFLPVAFVHGIAFRWRTRGAFFALTFGLFFSALAAVFTAALWPLALFGLYLNKRGVS